MADLSEEEIERVQAAARFAAKNGVPITKCPYDPAGDDQQRALAVVWVRVHNRTHPEPNQVSYEGEE